MQPTAELHYPFASDAAVAYRLLQRDLTALLDGEHDMIANAANCAALLFGALPEINWVGFYFSHGTQLVLGPFQGKPACVRIELGKGVCGAAAQTRRTQRIADVHAFPGHIACDSASNSELVVPLIVHERLIGVLDLDSPTHNRFSELDQQGIEAIAAIWLHACRFD
jgi:GAF domain-containing protein